MSNKIGRIFFQIFAGFSEHLNFRKLPKHDKILDFIKIGNLHSSSQTSQEFYPTVRCKNHILFWWLQGFPVTVLVPNKSLVKNPSGFQKFQNNLVRQRSPLSIFLRVLRLSRDGRSLDILGGQGKNLYIHGSLCGQHTSSLGGQGNVQKVKHRV